MITWTKINKYIHIRVKIRKNTPKFIMEIVPCLMGGIIVHSNELSEEEQNYVLNKNIMEINNIIERVSKADSRIQEYIDYQIKSHIQAQHEESEKFFGKNYWGLTISRCSEEEFKLWWKKNKTIRYHSYYYRLAEYVWDLQQVP